MAINFNTNPYFDDYDETKGYYKILFKPGVSVQARELTQLQTALQKQIERLGGANYKDGSRVLGGEFGYSNKLHAIKLSPVFSSYNVNDYIDQFVGVDIIGEDTGIEANVVAVAASTESDPPTLFVTYTNTGSDKETIIIGSSENIIAKGSTINGIDPGYPVLITPATDHSALSQTASVESGVYFINGHFVYIPAQRIIISKYTNGKSARIGLQVEEDIITATEDDSLLDNSQGSPNFSARGADRYSISANLTHIGVDEEQDNFIELQRIIDGRQIHSQDAATNKYSEWDRRLAKRTYEESGDYVIESFDIQLKETMDNGNNDGIWEAGDTTDTGNIASDDYLTVKVSSGIAYVSGHRIETIAPTYIDLLKPRVYNEFVGAATSVEVGNYVRVNNLYNMPDITGELAQGITAFKPVKIYDTFTATPGISSGNQIGTARIRGMEFDSGDQGVFNDAFNADTTYRAFLFDIKMFTDLTLSTAPEALIVVPGTLITGVVSGSYGYVNSASAGTTLHLTSVTGKFVDGEELISSASYEAGNRVVNSGGSTPVTMTTSVANTVDKAKQLFMDDPDGGEDFTSDLLMEVQYILTGQLSVTGMDLTGFNTSFNTELRVGDEILIPSGASGELEKRYIDTITSNTVATITSAVTNAVASVGATRARAYINDQEKNILLRKLSKDNIRTLLIDSNSNNSATSIEVRKQYETSSDTSGIATLSAGANQTFNAESNLDYTIAVLSAGTQVTDVPLAAGSVVNVNSNKVSIAGDGTNTLTITSPDLFGNGAKLKISATINKTIASAKTKTIKRSSKLRVDNKANFTDVDGPMVYGTSAHHREISMGVSDAYSVLAIYDSGVPGTDAVGDSLTISSVVGLFEKGEYVKGQTSGAIGISVSTTNPLEYVSYNGIAFQAGEQVVGQNSGAEATIDAVVAGDANIVNQFLLDTGQRDNFYDISRLILKSKGAKPSGDLLVVFDYFSHGSGDFFTVDSYNTIDYKEIPTYSATRIDPEIRNANGLYDLRSCVDFRPRVANKATTLAGGELYVTNASFDFESRVYSGSGSSKVDCVKDNSNFEYDFDYYLAKNSSLFLTHTGQFKIVDSFDSEDPQVPADIENAMRVADIDMPPYVISIDDVQVEEFNNRRYTMKDINTLEKRINSIEYYTALTLLEKDAADAQITDAYGLNRFKSGFLVDGFEGHSVGDAAHQDYRCSIDMTNRILRPKFVMKNNELIESANSEADRVAAGYVVKGGVAMLPYTHVETIKQTSATRVENLNPVLSFFWEGSMKLVPESDSWFETKYLPTIRVNVEGNYNTVLAQNRNALGTIWNLPVTAWTGATTTRTTGSRIFESTFANFVRGRGRRVLQRTVTDEIGIRSQSGIRTSIVTQTDYKTLSNKILARDIIPFMRAKDIFFEATGLKPFTRVYPFFDKQNVSRYCTQVTGSYQPKGDATTVIPQVDTWSSISKIEIYYDNNNNSAVTMRIDTGRDLRREFSTSYVERDYWVMRGQQNTPAVRSNKQDVMVFDSSNGTLLNLANPVTPNAKGELNFRLLMRPTETDSLRDHQIQIIEIVFYDQNGDVISNINNSEVVGSRNIANANNVVDTVDVNDDVINKILTHNSDRSLSGEAYVKDRNRNSNWYWDYQVSVRIIGGTFTIPTTSGNVTFVKSEDVDANVLVTDASGAVAGVFNLPDPNVSGNPKFQTGSREFRLTSSLSDGPDTESFTTADYTAEGTLQTRQITQAAIRNARIVRQSVSSTTRVTRQVDRGVRQVGWWDPLAQSILPQTEGGEFITKVDVYFSQKDEQIPVTMQIRTMENGTPTTTVLAGAEVTLNPENVNISANGTVATPFEFDTPVYLNENEEVAIVLMSNSQKYLCWISRLGELDAATGKSVSEQPYLGVLFKSQNNSTWTAYDYEDLKFIAYRAKFDISSSSVITFENDELPLDNLKTNPLEMTAGSNIIKVYHENHGMYGNSNFVNLSGVANDQARFALSSDFGDTDNTLTLVNGHSDWLPSLDGQNVTFRIYSVNNTEANDEIITADVAQSGNDLVLTNIVRAVGGIQGEHYTGSQIEYYELNGIPLNEINNVNLVVSNANLDYYTVTTMTNATSDAVVGAASVYATHNAVADAYQLMIPTLELPDTSAKVAINFIGGTSPSGSQPSYSSLPVSEAVPTERITLETPAMIASGVNEVNSLSSVKSCKVNITMSSTKDNLTPQIDLDRTTITTHMNRIDKIESSSDVYPAASYVAPTSPDGDSGEAVYITKRVQLADPATAIRVYFDAVRNDASDLEVMYKVLRSDDSTDFDEIGWTYFNGTGASDEPVPSVANRTSFLEYKYTENNIPEFIAFAIKIKMNGTNSSEVPLVKDLRAIALAV